MKLPIILITGFCISVDFSYSDELNKCNNSRSSSKPCESFDFLHEASKIPKIDPTKDSVIAKHCLHSKKDSTWELLLYERIVPLPVSEIQKECDVYSISGTINLETGEIFQRKFGSGMSAGCVKTCVGSKEACAGRNNKCKINTKKEHYIEHYIYHRINDFHINSCFKNIDIDKISLLFDAYLPIKMELEISCDGEKIPVLGSHYIYISGMCNEEQLEKIEEYNRLDSLQKYSRNLPKK